MILLILSVFLLLLSGCAEDSVDEAANCQVQLDNGNFQAVADNAGCSNYERGSAELGLAGFLFENFMAEDADSNFPGAFNLTLAECATSGPEALTGTDFNSAYQEHFIKARYWTKDKPEAENIARSSEMVEISFFATLGELIVQTYCQIDENLDGDISEADNQKFSQINPDVSSTETSSLDSSSRYFQIVSNGTTWLCYETGCREDSTYEGVWDKLDSAATETFATVTDGNITSVTAIVSIESLQPLFADSADITKPLQFLNMYTERAGFLLDDVAALGIGETDDIYENVSESVGQLDNGGQCSNDAVRVLDVLTSIVEFAAPYTSEADLPATNYQKHNLLDIQKISQIDTSESLPNCDFCPPWIEITTARLIFKKDDNTTYTGLYKTAADGIRNTLGNLAIVTLDPAADNLYPGTGSSNLKRIAADDEDISFKELLCLDSN